MKHTYCIVVLSLLAFSVQAQNSSENRPVFTQSNGVVVQERSGVEGFVQPVEPVLRENPISSWSLPVCMDALAAIEDKLSTFGTSDSEQQQKMYYLEQQRLIEERKQYLLTNP